MFWKNATKKNNTMYTDSIPMIHRAALDGDMQSVQDLCGTSNNMADALNLDLEFPIFSVLFLPAAGTVELKNDKVAIFRYLVQRQADVPSYLIQKNNRGETILHRIASNGFGELVDEVIQQAPALLHMEREDGSYPIHVAVLNGRLTVAQKLLLQPGVAQQKDAQGNLPLHLAAAHGLVDMTKACFEAFPAGINQPNDQLQTPLDLAKQFDNVNTRDFLIANDGKEDPSSEWINTKSPSRMG